MVHSPSMNSKKKALSAEARQGSIIQIAGPHDSGKMTILQLLSGQLEPSSGEVLISPHLQVLYVAHEPLFIQGAGLFGNLHMISTVEELQAVNYDRGLLILKRLRLDKPWIKDFSRQSTVCRLEHCERQGEPRIDFDQLAPLAFTAPLAPPASVDGD